MSFFKIILYILIAAALLAVSFGAYVFYRAYGLQKIEGVVYDCQTKQPLAGVSLRFSKNFFDALIGGDNGQYPTVQTDESGYFQIANKGDSFNFTASKEGYLNASEFGYNINKISFGILKRLPSDSTSEYSSNCKRSNECVVETTLPNGTIEFKNTCGPVDSII